jgi:DNA polymerase delta subunit 2
MHLFSRDLSQVDYKNLSNKFTIKEKNFGRQYAPLYAERLLLLRENIKNTALKKWQNQYEFKNLVDLNTNEKCIIIGTLYKEMENKPNILKELSEETMTIVASVKDRFTDDDDVLILEDELQRIALIGNIDKHRLCTGIVIALLGHEDETSKFVVDDFCFKETVHKANIELVSKTGDEYVVFVSGLEMSTESTDLMQIQLFVDFIAGDFIADGDDDSENYANIVCQTKRLVIVGNSLDSSTRSKDIHNKAKYLTKNYIAGSVSSIKQLDSYIEQLADKIEIDLMPGENDPSNYMMPQQPLHTAMFARSKAYKTFHTTTNPYEFEINGVHLIGISGQTVRDIKSVTTIDDPVDILRLTLDCGHLAPTCPDTLACYPYYGKDPFVLDNLPHVFFCGNQDEYKHETHRVKAYSPDKEDPTVHLITIPSFKKTHSCVFLNLRTLQTKEYHF